jgi:hypothetical protein
LSIPSFQQIEQRVFGLNKFSKVSFGSKPGGQPKIGVIFLTATPYRACATAKLLHFSTCRAVTDSFPTFRTFPLHWRVPFYTISNFRSIDGDRPSDRIIRSFCKVLLSERLCKSQASAQTAVTVRFPSEMALLEKSIDLFKLIDPFKQFALLERPQKLLALRAGVFVVVIVLFALYAAINSIIYSNTPEPSELTVETIPSGQRKQLLEFTIMIPMNGSDFFPSDPFETTYFSPLSKTLTVQKVAPQYKKMRIPEVFTAYRFLIYECYTFPVYGTLDPVTQSSTILNFMVARHKNINLFPVLFSINDDSSTRLRDLDFEQVFHAANNDMFPVYRIYQPGSSVTAVAFFEDFSRAGPEISIEVSLAKTVTSSNVELYKSMFAPPTYSPKTIVPPPPLAKQPNQRAIVVSIRPTVQVITFKPRNVFTLIGSITGVYPAFIGIAGAICGFIWSRISQDERGPDETSVQRDKSDHASGRMQDWKSWNQSQTAAGNPPDISVEMQPFQEDPLIRHCLARIDRIEAQMNAGFKSFKTDHAEILDILQELSLVLGSEGIPEDKQNLNARKGEPKQSCSGVTQARVIGALAPDRSRPKSLAPRASAQQGSHAGNPLNVSLPDVLEIPETPPRGRSRSRGSNAGNYGSRDA